MLFFTSAKVNAQPNLDSLWNVWSNPLENDSNRLNAINEFAWQGYLFSKPDSAFHFAQLQYEHAKSIGDRQYMAHALRTQGMAMTIRNRNDEAITYLNRSLELYTEQGLDKGKACIYNAFGNIYRDKAQYDLALDYFKRSQALFTKLDDRTGIADTYENLGNFYYDQGDWEKALDHFSRALMLYEESGNKRGRASILGALGSLHEYQHDLDKAAEYYAQSIEIYSKLGDRLGLASILNRMGSVNTGKGDYESAYEYYKQSLALHQEMDVESGIAYCYNSMGLISECRGDFEGALEYTRKGLKIGKEINFISLQAGSLGRIGSIHFSQGDYNTAIMYSNQALEMAMEYGIVEHIMNASEILYQSYKAQGKYDLALEMHELYTGMQDSILSEENQRAIIRQEYKFAYQKEALADSIASVEREYMIQMEHQAEMRRESMARNIYLGIGVLILLVAGGLMSRNRFIRKANARLEKEKDRAEKSEQVKQQFLANMSHEIRTPMNAVLGMTNLALDTELDEKQKSYLQAIKKSSLNLLVIINDILDLSKLEAGKMDIEKIPFRLSEIVKQVYDTLRFKAEEKGLVFETEFAEQVPDVLIGDPLRLNQVLLNLVGNAIKFTDNGRVGISVSVSEGTLSRIVFKVSDTGVGIPPSKLDKLFISFQQMDISTSRKFGGTGLGLAISKSLVEMQHGRIEAKSEPGKGSEFCFSIPYPVATEKQAVQLDEIQEIDIKALCGIRILLAEDNEYNRIVINDTLLNMVKNISIDHAENGQIAVDKLKSSEYDLVLMDANMPVMDGIEATRTIRNDFDEPKKNIPIIALSANVMSEDIRNFIKSGMNTYLPKPFTRLELINTLAKYYYNEEAVKEASNTPEELHVDPETIKAPSYNGKVTNLDFLSKFCSGDTERMKKYIDMYLEATPENLKKISQAMKKKDFQTLKTLVHTIKPHFQYMGMIRTKERAEDIEGLLSEKNNGGLLKELINLLGEDCNHSLVELAEFKA